MLQHKTETHVRPRGKRARGGAGGAGPGGARAPCRPADPAPAPPPRPAPPVPAHPSLRPAPRDTPPASAPPLLRLSRARERASGLPRSAACASGTSLRLRRMLDCFSWARLDRSPEDTRWKIVTSLTQQPTRDVP